MTSNDLTEKELAAGNRSPVELDSKIDPEILRRHRSIDDIPDPDAGLSAEERAIQVWPLVLWVDDEPN